MTLNGLKTKGSTLNLSQQTEGKPNNSKDTKEGLLKEAADLLKQEGKVKTETSEYTH